MTAPPYRAALFVGLGLFAVYALTLAPTTAFWDASEYIATAHILGIPHPPGNPLFVLLGRTWSQGLSLLGVPTAIAINLLAALTSAGASAFFFLVAHRVIAGLTASRTIALWGAVAGAVLGGTAFTVWNQSNVNEKVYTVSALIVAAVVWLAVLWRDRRSVSGSERLLLWAIFLTFLGLTNHLMSLLGAPALAVIVLFAGIGPLLSTRFLARAAALAVVGLSVNFVLPIRAELDPVINEGDPTCDSVAGAAVAIYTLGGSGCPDLAGNLRREQYQPVPITQRKAPIGDQLENYYQYFDWQWARSVKSSVLPGGASTPFTVLFLGLGLLGLVGSWRSDRAIGAGVLVLAGSLTLGLVVYLNFRFGFSLAPEIADMDLHEVRERDYFYVAGFMFWGSLAGIGLARGWIAVARLLAGHGPPWRTRESAETKSPRAGDLGFGDFRQSDLGHLGDKLLQFRRQPLRDRPVPGLDRSSIPKGAVLRSAPVLAIALLPLALNWSWASRSGDYAARDWAYNLLMSVEPYSVLFTNGDNDTFPLWYVQEVEGIRRDVTVVVGQYLHTSWYIKQLAELTSPENQRPLDADLVTGLYEAVDPPTRSIINLDPEILDSVGGARLGSDLSIALAEVVAIYPAGTQFTRADQLTLRIIQDARRERPIYFSSLGGAMARLGLTRWSVRHGLALKLMPLRENYAPAGWISVDGGAGPEWINLEHSLDLYRNVYSFRGLRDREVWHDRAVSVVWQFYFAVSAMGRAVQLTGGDQALQDSLFADRDHFRALGETGFARPDD